MGTIRHAKVDGNNPIFQQRLMKLHDDLYEIEGSYGSRSMTDYHYRDDVMYERLNDTNRLIIWPKESLPNEYFSYCQTYQSMVDESSQWPFYFPMFNSQWTLSLFC